MHLYLHVPFCARRCSYCDFAIAIRRVVPSDGYADAVLAEWERRSVEAPWDGGGLETIYFGGGTPSRLEPAALGRIIERIATDRELAPGAEVTLEANPDDVTPAGARAWRAAGINRVSLGVQSFEPAVLAWMHRTHESEQVAPAVDALRAAGVGSISLDLIFGLPSALGRNWQADLDRALALGAEHLSLYGLTVEPGTPLGRWVGRGETVPVDEDRYAAEYLAAHAALRGAGYDHYEVSNAALPGRRAVHNGAYWRRAPYLGLGPSAHSAAGRQRWWNIREWSAYQRAIAGGGPAIAGDERLDDEAVRLEELYLGLRTADGVAAGRVDPALVARWLRDGWAVTSAGRVRLTAEGWLRLDALAAAAAAPSECLR